MGKISRQGGFTIIEIMIIVGVIGILVALAIPAYRDYALRAKVAEAILAFGECRNIVSEVFLTGDSLPNTGEWGCEKSGPVSTYVNTINVTNMPNPGTITIELRGDPHFDLQDITLVPLNNTGIPPAIGDGVARWRCGAAGDGTTLNPKYLPGTCRGV